MSLRRELREYRSCSPEVAYSPSCSESGSVFSPFVVGKPHERELEQGLPRNPELIFPAYQDRTCPQQQTRPSVTEQADTEENVPLLPTKDIEETIQFQEELVRRQRSSPVRRTQSPPYTEFGTAYVQHIVTKSQKAGYAVYIPRNPELLFPAFQDRKTPRPQPPTTGQPGTEEILPVRQEIRQQHNHSIASRVQSPTYSEYGSACSQSVGGQLQEMDYTGYSSNNPQSNVPPHPQPIFPPPVQHPYPQLIQQPLAEQCGAPGRIPLGQEPRRTCPPVPDSQSSYRATYQQPVVSQPQEIGHSVNDCGHFPNNSQPNSLPVHQKRSSQPSPRSQNPMTAKPSAEESVFLPRDLCQQRNCPPGLEYLNIIDKLVVQEEAQIFEMMTESDIATNYSIKNSMGERVFYAAEKSDVCEQYYFGKNRSFIMNIYDHNDQEVIHIFRPLACSHCLYPCCLQRMEISAPPGTVIGSIHQEWTFITPKFHIKNESGEIVLIVKGPTIPVSFGGDLTFHIYSKEDSTKIGKIIKKRGGYVQEVSANFDSFGMIFPLNLNVKYKALLLGVCFLLDFVYFKEVPRRTRR